MNKKQNPFGLVAGDVVEIFFDHRMGDEVPFVATVTKVSDRTDINQDAHIHYSRHDGKTNEPVTPDGCSVSWVVRVISRIPRHLISPEPTVNNFSERFREDVANQQWLGYQKFDHGVRASSLHRLTCVALASAKGGGLDRPLSEERLHQQWNQSRFPGQVKAEGIGHGDLYFFDDRLYVHWKVFKKWVIRNRNRLLMSQSEIEEAGREYDEAMRITIEESWGDDLDFIFPDDQDQQLSCYDD